MKWIIRILIIVIPLILIGCTTTKSSIPTVTKFEIDRYMGTWYEIARLDHSFERGLSDVSATYTLLDDGRVRVLNRGVKIKTGERTQIEGKARIRKGAGPAELSVTFFWPFSGAYRIIALEEDYSHAMVCSSGLGYLWILARSPQYDSAIYRKYIELAEKYGFKVEDLLIVSHNVTD